MRVALPVAAGPRGLSRCDLHWRFPWLPGRRPRRRVRIEAHGRSGRRRRPCGVLFDRAAPAATRAEGGVGVVVEDDLRADGVRRSAICASSSGVRSETDPAPPPPSSAPARRAGHAASRVALARCFGTLSGSGRSRFLRDRRHAFLASSSSCGLVAIVTIYFHVNRYYEVSNGTV